MEMPWKMIIYLLVYLCCNITVTLKFLWKTVLFLILCYWTVKANSNFYWEQCKAMRGSSWFAVVAHQALPLLLDGLTVEAGLDALDSTLASLLAMAKIFLCFWDSLAGVEECLMLVLTLQKKVDNKWIKQCAQSLKDSAENCALTFLE